MTTLITGASRGIGKALAELFAENGEQVICAVRTLPEDRIAGAEYLTLDVTDPASHRDLAAALAGRPIDTLVCNAGVYLDKGNTLDAGFAAEDWAATYAANVTGVFLTVQALLPNLRAAAPSKIAILSSIMASSARAPGGSYIYRSSKAAVLNLGRNLAADLRGQDIAVGIYHPGWVRTEMGGDSADISVDESVSGLWNRIGALSLETTGCFKDYAGTQMPF